MLPCYTGIRASLSTSLLFKSWSNHEDVLNVQMKKDYRKEWQAAMPELLARPRDVTIWEAVRADGTISVNQALSMR